MVSVSGVSIDIDLGIKEAKIKIKALKKDLHSLDDTINIDVNVNRDELDELRNDLQDVEKNVEVTKDVKESASGTSSDVDGDGDGDGGKSSVLPDLKRDDSYFDRVAPDTDAPIRTKDRSFGLPDSPEDASKSFGLSDKDALEIVDKRKSRGIDKPRLTSVKKAVPDSISVAEPDISDSILSKEGGDLTPNTGPRKTASLTKGPDLGGARSRLPRDFTPFLGDFDVDDLTPETDIFGDPRVDLSEMEVGWRSDRFDVATSGGRPTKIPDFDRFKHRKSRVKDIPYYMRDKKSKSLLSSFLEDPLDFSRERKGDGDGPHLGSKLKGLIPNMRTWRRMFAVLIPLIISMAGALAGVASAMIGAVGAGAAFIGLGLVGHGEDMETAFANARKEISELGSEIFNVMQNPAKKFAPIQEEIFDMIPGEMTGLAESLEGLAESEALVNLIKTGIKGLIGWVGALIDMFVDHADTIAEVSSLFGNLIGQNVIDFFEYFIEDVSSSQNSLILFGHALKTILLIIYNLSKAFSGILVAFQPVFDILLAIAQLLNNKIVMAVISAIAVFTVLVGTMLKLNALMLAFGSGAVLTSIFNVVTAVGSLVSMLLGALNVASSLAVTLGTIAALTGAGVLAVLAGVKTYNKLKEDMSPSPGDSFSGPGGAGSSTVINNNEINISGDADRKSREKMFDAFDERSGQEKAMDMGQ